MERTTININDRPYPLAQNTDIDALKADLVAAVRDGGQFVDFTVVGNRALSVLVTAGVPIVFESEQVRSDDRDTGDLDHPFDEVDLYVPGSFYE